MAASDIEIHFTPIDAVESYRFDSLSKAGYTDAVAFHLAIRPLIDLHVAMSAIGCGSELEALWLLGVIED